ncbi:hypothetical protein SK128_001990 [Halocaridina rubra]|uniref:Potassium channel domain-containing protein n=1 Tax=Halocaridina rubra TaxID=373956 RepID=A0AAN8X9I5_HALRR
MTRLTEVQQGLIETRQKFIDHLVNLSIGQQSCGNSDLSPVIYCPFKEFDLLTSLPTEVSLEEQVKNCLRIYDQIVTVSTEEGVSLEDEPVAGRWHYTQSLFFSATVLTTIGYGNIAPSTPGGRLFCMIFALVGIPLNVSVIAVIGEGLASALPLGALEQLMPESIRAFCVLQMKRGKLKTVATILSTVSILVGFISLGGVIFMTLEEWTFMESFYFCFISTTTIGFGDLVPGRTPMSLVCCTLYVLVGLALTSTVFELVRRQYASSWAQMKELSARLHSLSGPLAEAMKRFAETGAGVVEMDVDLMKELRDFNIALAKVQSEDDDYNQETTEDPWTALLNMAEKKKRITIIMYESNV